jgi:hypothetical protein
VADGRHARGPTTAWLQRLETMSMVPEQLFASPAAVVLDLLESEPLRVAPQTGESLTAVVEELRRSFTVVPRAPTPGATSC